MFLKKLCSLLVVFAALVPVMPGSPGGVEIIRDRWGIAHVYAGDEKSLFYGAGYAMAEDRLLQMMLRRRAAQGRLAEILGAGPEGRFIKADRRARILSFYEVARRQLPRLTAQNRRNLESFAAGVNACIADRRGSLGPIFARYGGEPEPWIAEDSVALWDFNGDRFLSGWEEEVRTKRLHEAELAAGRQPAPEPRWKPEDESAEIVSEAEFRRSNLEAYRRLKGPPLKRKVSKSSLETGPTLEMKASQNWVVAGARSTTGKPILESDPQVAVQSPSFGYEIHLVGGRYNVRGMCFPGSPGMLIGYSNRCAWGMTALGGDNADLFEEKVNPDNPEEYLWKGTRRKIEKRSETILVKGQPPVILDIRRTHHGPVVNDLVAGVKPGEVFALRSAPLTGVSSSLEAILETMTATGWQSLRRAMSKYLGPPAHLIYADAAGNIGYQTLAATPIRNTRSQLPRKGWTGDEEWKMVPFQDLPSLLNPKSGAIFTANHLAAGSWYPYLVGTGRGDGPRSWRLRELLAGDRKFSVEGFVREIHGDSVNPAVRDVVRLIIKLLEVEGGLDETQTRALRILKGWDFRLLTRSEAFPLAAGILSAIQTSMQEPRNLGYTGTWPGVSVRLKQVMPRFQKTGKVPDDPQLRAWLKEIFRKSLAAPASLAGLPGAGRDAAVHRMPYQDNGLELGSLAPEHDLVSPPLDCPVVQTIWSQTGESYVQVVDLANVDRSLSLLPPGISEIPESAHFKDQVGLWVEGGLHPAPLGREAVLKLKKSARRLDPRW